MPSVPDDVGVEDTKTKEMRKDSHIGGMMSSEGTHLPLTWSLRHQGAYNERVCDTRRNGQVYNYPQSENGSKLE